MKKYQSGFIKENDLTLETRSYFENNIRHDVVKLSHSPTGFSSAATSTKGQIYAYNLALHELECKLNEVNYHQNIHSTKITPHKNGDKGTVCLPLVKNVPDPAHPDWVKVFCKKCGAECWESDAARMVMAQGNKGYCTICALNGK